MAEHQVLLMEKEQVEQALRQMAREIIKIVTAPRTLSDWITEDKASEILGYNNANHMRMVARNNEIKLSKRGKKFYYSLKSINEYLDEFQFQNGSIKRHRVFR